MDKFGELIGTWHLKQFVVINKSGETNEWRKGEGQGILIYSNDGYMSVSINANPTNLNEVTDPKELLDRCLFYAGTFEVVAGAIKHRVLFATNGQRVGQEMIRDYRLEANQLLISAQGDYGSSLLTWERKK